MIRHMVLVRFSPNAVEDERTAVMAGLKALRSKVTGMLSFAGGPNVSQEGRSAGFTHAFTMDFVDEAARDAYLSHPAHVEAATKLVGAAAGDSGRLVVDIRLSSGHAAGR